MADHLEFGDGPGVLGGRAQAGDQNLAVTAPAGVYLYDLLRVVGDVETLSERARGGDDRIEGAAGITLIVIGDAAVMHGHAQGGNDTVSGSAAPFNQIYGDALLMSDRAIGGDDDLTAPSSPYARNAASSDLFGDARTLSGRAQGGDDTLVGGFGYEGTTARLFGDGQDLLDRARGGDDLLISRSHASDEMWGDAFNLGPQATTGADVFRFSPGNGRDIIHDFEQGRDRIELSGFGVFGINDFDDLAQRLCVQPDGTLLILDVGGSSDNSVVLSGVFDLRADDVIFG